MDIKAGENEYDTPDDTVNDANGANDGSDSIEDMVVIDSPPQSKDITEDAEEPYNDNDDESDELLGGTQKRKDSKSVHGDAKDDNEDDASAESHLYQVVKTEDNDNESDPNDIDDTKDKEIVISQTEQVHVQISNPDKKVTDEEEDPEDEKSCCLKFMKNFGKWLFVILVITTIILVSILISFNQHDENSAAIIGLACFNMIFCATLMPLITIMLLKMWTTKTWALVFFLIYLSLIVAVFAMGTYIKELQIPLIIYGVVKILLIVQAFRFAKNDGKFFIPAIISEFISIPFIKSTNLHKLIYFFIAMLTIQIIIMCLGCLAFVIQDNESWALFIIALVLFTWIINTFRHFGTYMVARVLAYNLSAKYASMREQNADYNVVKQAFKDTLDKFTTIVIGSLAITSTPTTYFLTNLMSGIRIITAGLVLCCAPLDNDENACCCIPAMITVASAITNGLAWLVRKISKWTLRVTAKTILIQAGFEDTTFIGAIVAQNKKALKENKEMFGSDMLFLDNCMLSSITHLCILVSSLGALLSFAIQPNAAIICWIAGYAACRTMVEMIDVILQFFVIAWSIEPGIIYENKVLYEDFKHLIKETFAQLYPNEGDEEIMQRVLEIEMRFEQVTGYQKTTDPTVVSNIQHHQSQLNAIQQTNVGLDGDGKVLAVQQNEAVVVKMETNEIGSNEDPQSVQLSLQNQTAIALR